MKKLTINLIMFLLAVSADAAVSYRSVASATGSGATITISKPAGTTVGDLLLVDVTCFENYDEPSGPSDWYRIFHLSDTPGTDRTKFIWFHVVDADDASVTEYTWTKAGANNWAGSITCASGADPFMPIDGAWTVTGDSFKTGRRVAYTNGYDWPGVAGAAGPVLTTTRDGSLVYSSLGLVQSSVVGTVIPPSGTTKIVEAKTSNCSSLVAYYTATTAGAQTAKTWTGFISTNSEWLATEVAIRPDLSLDRSGPFYVDPVNGSDDNDGIASDNAWASLNYACNILRGGPYTINLMTGTQSQYGAVTIAYPSYLSTDTTRFGLCIVPMTDRASMDDKLTITEKSGDTARPERLNFYSIDYLAIDGLTITATQRDLPSYYVGDSQLGAHAYSQLLLNGCDYATVTNCDITGWWEFDDPYDWVTRDAICLTGSTHIDVSDTSVKQVNRPLQMDGAYSDITFTNVDIGAHLSSGVFCGSSTSTGGITLDGCRIHSNPQWGKYHGSAVAIQSDYITIRNCLLVSSRGSGIINGYELTSSSDQAYPTTADTGYHHITIENCISHGSLTTTFINLQCLDHDIIVRNNTFLSDYVGAGTQWLRYTGAVTFSFDPDATPSNIVVKNNLFGCLTSISAAFAASEAVDWDYNVMWSYASGGTQRSTPLGANDILMVTGVNTFADGFSVAYFEDAGSTFVGHPIADIWDNAWLYSGGNNQSWAWPLLPASGSFLVGAADSGSETSTDYFGNAKTTHCIGAIERGTGSAPSAWGAISPVNNATNVLVDADLSWDAVSGAESYDVIWGTDSSPDGTEWIQYQSGTSYVLDEMSRFTTYYWHPIAWNQNGYLDGGVKTYTTQPVPKKVLILSGS